MNYLPSDTSYVPRSKRQLRPKKGRRRFLKVFLTILLVILIAGGTFLYGTNQGLQFRRMLVGTVLTSQHPQYVKYMWFLLSKSEIDKLNDAYNRPKAEKSTITKHINAANLKDSIKVNTINTANFTAKVMIIPNPEDVHLVASRYNFKGQALSDLITQNHAIAGINAGGFADQGGTGSGGQAMGVAISNGKVITATDGNNVSNIIGGFLKDGQFITGNYTVNQLLDLGIRDAVSFRPQLIVNGKNAVTPSIDGAWGWAPRTAIGQTKDGRVIMIITDGRFYWDKTHRGASMLDMVHLMEKYNVVNAIAMDGGGSTTMIKDNKLLLKPATSTRVGMRYLPNAWIVS